jgi:hypothetical protein
MSRPLPTLDEASALIGRYLPAYHGRGHWIGARLIKVKTAGNGHRIAIMQVDGKHPFRIGFRFVDWAHEPSDPEPAQKYY